MKIVFLDEATINLNGDIDYSSYDQFESFTTYPTTPPDQVITRLQNADCVITNKTPITAQRHSCH